MKIPSAIRKLKENSIDYDIYSCHDIDKMVESGKIDFFDVVDYYEALAKKMPKNVLSFRKKYFE